MARTRRSLQSIPHKRETGEVWTAYESGYGRQRGGGVHVEIKAPGEYEPLRYTAKRPATEAEVEAEVIRRSDAALATQRRMAFTSRPEYEDAGMIRSTIEMMDEDNGTLDRLTPKEWRELRIKICG